MFIGFVKCVELNAQLNFFYDVIIFIILRYNWSFGLDCRGDFKETTKI